MKKTLGIVCSLLFLVLGLYSYFVIFINVLTGTQTTLSAWDWITTVISTASIVACGYLTLYYRNHNRIGRFNADIFSTICLFFAFMFSFLLPAKLPAAFGTLNSSIGFFGAHDTIRYLSANGVGIYEAFYFVAMLCVGLTIGEGKQSYDD